jgi:hypothetical protein
MLCPHAMNMIDIIVLYCLLEGAKLYPLPVGVSAIALFHSCLTATVDSATDTVLSAEGIRECDFARLFAQGG